MVVFDVRCEAGHCFEVWVPSAEKLDEQIAKGWVQCPYCGCTVKQRLPAAPSVHTERQQAPKAAQSEEEALWAALKRLARELKAHAEDVGRRFPEEARKIHRGEAPLRPIRGEATRQEVEELWEERIWVLPLPPDENLH